MRCFTSVFVITLCVGAVGPSVAQAQLKPIITRVAVPVAQLRVSRENLVDDGFIDLSWSATHPITSTYEWELSFDNQRSEANPSVELLVLPDDMLCDESPNNECRGDSIPSFQYKIQVKPSEVLPASAKTVVGARGTRQLWLRVFRQGSLSDLEVDSLSWEFDYDTEAPAPLPITEVFAGDKSFIVAWDESAAPDDVEQVEVALCLVAVTSSTGPQAFCDAPKLESGAVENGQITIDDDTLETSSFYRLALRAQDDFTNVGEFGPIVVAQPIDLIDFFELYKAGGGSEDGGNCFVATAAHGSYAHPVVRLLRVFRDQVLARSLAGQAFIQGYYALSPPVAHSIAQSPTMAAATRLALIPIAILAALILILPFVGALALAFVFGRRLRRGLRHSVAIGLIVLGASALSSPAAAQYQSRTQARLDSDLKWFGIGIEFRGGPYSPFLAKNDAAFRTIFLDDKALDRVANKEEIGDLHRVMLSLGLEAQLYRGIGTLAVGGSLGYTKWSGHALTPAAPGIPSVRSDSSNTFNLLPLTFTATYRFDWLLEHTVIPLVPYVRGGLAYYRWWVDDGRGATPKVGDQSAKGGVPGLTGSLGISFLMNVLEPRAARSLSDSTGIRGTYLFAEFNANKVDGFSDEGFDFSDATWNIGMFLEL